MPPKTTKRATKALPKASSAIPDPFTPVPTEILPLLDTLDKEIVYITHIDHHPAWFKKRVFFVPVGLNVTIGLVLLWRAYAASPWYWSILMSFLGNHNETTIYFASTPWLQLIWMVLVRSSVFLVDFILFRIIGPWPWGFFFESPGNPISWRFKTGFRDEEVYVRESRGWGARDLLGEAEGSSGRAGSESPFFKTRILPAVETRRLAEKTGYMLMDKDFDLSFAAMTKAAQMIDRKEITLDNVQKSVFVWVGSQETGQWTVWDCWKLDGGSETEARKKIMIFKDRLTAMGKESLFFRWVELIQFESSAPGGFTQERQIEAANKAKKLFEDEGIDFDTFIKEIGGLDGLPGME
ncbi:hypothetical protein BU24DRAFT_419371 [Aaosphaeria arxii CBS 175.79]|uniref:Uncharacterized protein n=1 Tax=Aaosphaeria arxii CBS 175.79 TaxID=1450172 RepID=A0A6A5Y4N0_9PLEO|nr:uncharacterized protein BU24DRAFT_419371 [Aaosphaeria arxii CBS 175.79]KAF2019750.1 hypothetical protein BU24DRAFT_419371 [Aaosphaeria arxii CBS 175.79]